MRTTMRHPSPERFLASGVVVGIVIAFVATCIPTLDVREFLNLVAVLIASDLVLYVLTKTRIIKSSGTDEQ